MARLGLSLLLLASVCLYQGWCIFLTEQTWHNQLDSGDEVGKFLDSDHEMAREKVSQSKDGVVMGMDITGKYTLKGCLHDLVQKNRKGRGIVFDFKDKQTLTNAVPEFNKEAKEWMWVQAPVVDGPDADKTVKPIAAISASAKTLDKQIKLVFSWTTAGHAQTETPYTEEQIKKMVETLNEANVKTHKTAVQVDAVHGSHTENLATLLRDADYLIVSTVDDSAATADKVNVQNLRQMADEFGHQRVFWDVSHKLRDKLNVKF